MFFTIVRVQHVVDLLAEIPETIEDSTEQCLLPITVASASSREAAPLLMGSGRVVGVVCMVGMLRIGKV